MNARIMKDIRALLPFWGFGLLAPGLGRSLTGLEGAWHLAFYGSLVGLAVTAFGTEITHQTLGHLLSQPISRGRLWWEKIGVLGMALASVTLVFAFAFSPERAAQPGEGLSPLQAVWMFALCAFGGGVGFTLLLRNVQGAFWLALLMPWVVAMASEFYREKLRPNSGADAWVPAAWITYSILAIIIGWWRFRTMQDVSAQSRAFGLGTEKLLFSRSKKPRSAWGVLVRKEILLQQTNWAFALCVLAILLLTPLWEHLARPANTGYIGYISVFRAVLFGLLVCVLPLMIGAMSIAEERHLGVLEWQQALPVSRLKQWLIKVLICFLLTLVLAWLAPAFVSSFVFRNDTDFPFAQFPEFDEMTIIPFCILAAGLWASSFSRNFLQALVTGAGVLVIGFWFNAELFGRALPFDQHRLLQVLVWPILSLVAFCLAYTNFRLGYVTARHLAKAVAIFFAWFGILVSSLALVHFRAWEWFIPEPAPTPGLSFPQKIQAQLRLVYENGVFLMPDGSLWTWNSMAPQQLAPATRNGVPTRISAETKWVAVAGSYNCGLAIREPGSLWAWGHNYCGQLGLGGEPSQSRSVQNFEPLQQVGNDSDWVAVETCMNHTLALKRDGSLWAWGKNQVNQLGIPEIKMASTPQQVGADTDWISIAALPSGSIGIKKNGTLWGWGIFSGRMGTPKRADRPRQIGFDTDWVRATGSGNLDSYAAQKANGTWWAGETPIRLMPWQNSPPGDTLPVPLNLDPNLKAAGLDFFGAVAIRQDGSLWQYGFNPPQSAGPSSQYTPKPARVGKRNDWLAATISTGRCVGLTADGWLWTWGRPPGANPSGSLEKWLSTSDRPKRFFNVITGQAP